MGGRGEGDLVGKLFRAGETEIGDSGTSRGDSECVNDAERGDEGESACVGEPILIS